MVIQFDIMYFWASLRITFEWMLTFFFFPLSFLILHSSVYSFFFFFLKKGSFFSLSHGNCIILKCRRVCLFVCITATSEWNFFRKWSTVAGIELFRKVLYQYSVDWNKLLYCTHFCCEMRFIQIRILLSSSYYLRWDKKFKHSQPCDRHLFFL